LIWDTYQAESAAVAKRLSMRLGFKKDSYYKIIHSQGVIRIPQGHSSHQLTFQELLDEFVINQHFTQISLPTLWSYLEDRLITLKNADQLNQNGYKTALNRVTDAKVHSHFAHMMSFFPAILALHDV
jgi:hypothetical protein